MTIRTDWDLKSHSDLKKIPLFGEDKVDYNSLGTAAAESLRLKRRLAGLRRLGLVKGKEVTPLGRAFVDHCLSGYTTFKGKLSLSHSTDPESYPEIGKRRGGQHEEFYYEDLGRANESLRENVFECSSLLEDAPKIVQSAMDANSRFGRYGRIVERAGRHYHPWHANWDCYGGNGWGANDQHLVSDYDEDHFSSIIDDWPDHDFVSQAEAFASIYYELWALAVWAWHYHQVTGEDELMYQWRWNLADCYESRCDEICDFLSLIALRDQFAATAPAGTSAGVTHASFGPVFGPKEFGADSDTALESLEPYVEALESTIRDIHAEVAAGMRANGSIVVEQSGLFHCVLNNGAETTSKPFLDTVKALILDTYNGPAIDAPLTAAFRKRALATLAASDVSSKYYILSGIEQTAQQTDQKGNDEDPKPA
jgi:hypothetical protein